jgi:hypothetical protein
MPNDPALIVEQITLEFKGEAHPINLETSQLIKIIRGYTKIVQYSGKLIYGGRANTKVSILELKSGSIDISTVAQVVAAFQPFFATLPIATFGVTSITETIKEWLSLLTHLGGEPPRSTAQTGDGQNVKIENQKGDTKIVNGNVYQTFIFGDIGANASSLQEPFLAGATDLILKKSGKEFAQYSAREAKNFVPIRPTYDKISSSIPVILSVVSPVLEGDGVWKFRLGASNILATITDEAFLARVYNGAESFRKGDSFKVELKTEQKQVGRKIVTEHFITAVICRV